nr:high-affinity nickel-transport protein [uncultured bacterium]
MEWLSNLWTSLTWENIWASLTWQKVLFSAAIFVISVVLSVLIVAVVVVKIPANYFSPHYQQDFLPDASWFTRWGAVIVKNIVGLVLIAAGIVMLIGPGQGVLTILIGLMMMDIPGKRPLEARIIQRPGVLSAVNSLRARYNKPPLILD